MSEIARFYLGSVAERAGLSLNWRHTPKTSFLMAWLICLSQEPGTIYPYPGRSHQGWYAARFDHGCGSPGDWENRRSCADHFKYLPQLPWPENTDSHSLQPGQSTVMYQMSHLVIKPTNWHVRPAMTQISLGIHPFWSEFSLSAWRKNLRSSATHWVHSKDSDQTGQMPRLIRVFAGHTVILLVFSWGGSNVFGHEWYSKIPQVLFEKNSTIKSSAVYSNVKETGNLWVEYSNTLQNIKNLAVTWGFRNFLDTWYAYKSLCTHSKTINVTHMKVWKKVSSIFSFDWITFCQF